MIMPRIAGIFSYLILLWCAVPLTLPAQTGEKMVWDDRPAALQVKKSDRSLLQVHVTVPGVFFIRRKADGGSYIELSRPGMVHAQRTGWPDLPVLRRLITLPGGGEAVVEKVTYHSRRIPLSEKFPGTKLYPRQPSLPKNVRPPQHLKIDREAYARDAWTGDSLVTVHTAGIMRGRKLAWLTIAPFRYNPARDLLEVYDEVEVTIRFTGGTAKNAAVTASPFFSSLKSATLNSSVTETGQGLVTAPVRYIILTDTLFRNTLREFVRWKTRKGYRVDEIYTTDAGVGSTPDSIRDYLTNLYLSATPDDPAPTFLLIVGDTPQVPASAVPGHVTDLYYATYDGDDDYLPDLYYGRIPARDTSELRVMLDKILEYEKYTFHDPSFLSDAVMVAGVDGTYAPRWGNGQINYAVSNYVNAAHGYDPSVYLYPASGNSDAEIRQKIGDGCSLVNYTGHGLSSGWQDPSFKTSDIRDLQNAHKYPVFITNGCETATFGLDECFGEAMVRAEDKGAVAYIGCSDDSYWDEDYYWAVGVGPIVEHPSYGEYTAAAYDRLFHDHGEPPQEWYVTTDQIIFAGNVEVMAGNPARAKYYWQIYNVLGDPSMMPWLSVPLPMGVHVPSSLPAGTGAVTVVTEPGSYVGVTRGDTLLAAALTGEDGMSSLALPSLPDTAYLLVTVTRQNRIPVMDTVYMIPDSLPYVSVKHISTDDGAGNADTLPDNGEDVFLDMTVRNSGSLEARNVMGKLSCNTPWVIVTDSLSDVFTLGGGESRLLPHAFRYRVRDSIPDGAVVTFHISFTGEGDGRWDHWFTQTLLAPQPETGSMRIEDRSKGNGNFRLEAGESVDLVLQLINRGHAVLPGGYVLFSLTDSLVLQPHDSVPFAAIPPGATTEVTFPVVIDPGAPAGAELIVTADMLAGGYFISDTFSYPVGLVYEDFETGDFRSYPWQNNSDIPWVVTGGASWRGEFSAASGDIGDGQRSTLEITCVSQQSDSVSFYHRVSSESGYDFLRFSIDGTEKDKWSGETAWSRSVYPVEAGDHTFSWSYTKDGNTSSGMDKAWIDYIVFPGGCFTGYDAGVIDLLAPESAPDLGEEKLKVVVKNFGSTDLQTFPLLYRVNDGDAVRDTLMRTLAPGDTAHFVFSVPVDMSVLKSYRIYISTEIKGDQMPLNNGITETVTHKGTLDLVLDSLLSPARDSAYTAFEEVAVSVINASTGAVDTFPLFFRVNNAHPVFQAFDTVLAAGDTGVFRFSHRVDMADTGQYLITVYISLPTDSKQGNDTISVWLYNVIQGTGKMSLPQRIRLYPNPAGERITLQPSFRGDKGTLLLLGITGRKYLIREDLHWQAGEEIVIPLTGLAPGTYLLILTEGHRSVSMLFVKR